VEIDTGEVPVDRSARGLPDEGRRSDMTAQVAFTPQEWTLLRTVPALVTAGVSAADPGGLIGAVKEASGGMMQMLESLKSSQLELMTALLADKSRPEVPDTKTLLGEGSREQQIANFKAALMAKIGEAGELVSRKATPEEAQAYKQMLMSVAERAANAAKEGGFLFFGGERVSAAEQTFLSEVKNILHLA
jgi:hypothetical protein